MAFGVGAMMLFPQDGLQAGTFAIAGMGELFAASVRAPLTGIVLVLEMIDSYQLILLMIITCLGVTLLAQFLGEQAALFLLVGAHLAAPRAGKGCSASAR